MMVVIVPSGEFFFTKTKQKKCQLGLTSTYEYKTIHTSVWMLPQGEIGDGGGGGALFLKAQLSSPVPQV